LVAAELTISKQNNQYQIALTVTDAQGNTIITQFQGPLPYYTLE
jgi:ribosomal protein S3AE